MKSFLLSKCQDKLHNLATPHSNYSTANCHIESCHHTRCCQVEQNTVGDQLRRLHFISFCFFKSITGNRLNEYISHYEPLSYDREAVHRAHTRAKRAATWGGGAGSDDAVHLTFTAHGRHFRLRLKRDVEVFSNDLEVHGPDGPVEFDTSHIYKGHLIGRWC